MKFHVPEMSCGHCTATITKSVTAADPSAEVKTDLETHTVEITTQASHAEMVKAIKAAGYDAAPV
jgi:copper chaperone